ASLTTAGDSRQLPLRQRRSRFRLPSDAVARGPKAPIGVAAVRVLRLPPHEHLARPASLPCSARQREIRASGSFGASSLLSNDLLELRGPVCIGLSPGTRGGRLGTLSGVDDRHRPALIVVV